MSTRRELQDAVIAVARVIVHLPVDCLARN